MKNENHEIIRVKSYMWIIKHWIQQQTMIAGLVLPRSTHMRQKVLDQDTEPHI